MATTQNTFTGNGSNLGPFSFTFKWLEPTDIKVSVGGVLKTAGTHYNLQNLSYTTKTGGEVLFTSGNAPASGSAIRVFRDTDDSALSATFNSGSAIRSQDLNDNFTQNLYVVQEVNNNAVQIDGGQTMVGNLNMGGYDVINLATQTALGYSRWRKVATAGQTTFSGTGDSGGVLAYLPLREQVFINGVLQQRDADYSASNGTSITFSVGLVVGDIVEVVCINSIKEGSLDNASEITYGGQFTGQSSRTVAAKLADVVSVKDFGAVGDGVADDTAAIQAAIDSVAAQGGGKIHMPNGRYKVTATIDITSSSTILSGSGGDGPHDAGTNVDGATRIEWAGSAGGTVVKVRTVPNLASGSKIYGSGIENIEIKCNGLGGIGVIVQSVNKVILRYVHVESPTIAAYKFTTLQKNVDLNEATDVQASLFEGLSWRCIEAGTRNAHGIWLTSHGFPSTANVSLNVFMNCGGQNWGQTGTTGIGYFIEDGDNINWIRCSAYRVYTDVPAVEIRGNVYTDSHHFYNCTFGGANGIRIKGIASGYLSDPVRCSFYAMDNGNGTQYPTLDAGCRVSYHSDQGVFEKFRATSLVLADGVATASTGSTTNETVRIYNTSENHLRLADANSNEWGLNINSTTGDLRLTRSGASGVFAPGNTVAGTLTASGLNLASSGITANGIYLGATNTIYFSTNTFARAVLNASGQFGINTTSPVTLLDVSQPAGTAAVSISSIEKTNNTVGGISGGEFIGSRGDGNDSFFGRLGLGFRRNDGTAIQSAMRVGGLVFGGQHGTTTTYDSASTRYSASVVGVSEGTYTNATTMPTGIAFRTGSSGDDIRAANGAFGSERARITNTGQLLIGTTATGASKLVVNDDSIQVNTSKTPATSTATGTTGQIAWDSSYIYVCTATNTWKRAALATW